MSVYIKGMEVPTSCRACRFAGLGGRRCELNVCMFTGESQPTLSPNRMSNCPLVPVPDHGRLIDGDVAEVISFKNTDADGNDFCDGVLYAADWIARQPTIIPASKEDGE